MIPTRRLTLLFAAGLLPAALAGVDLRFAAAAALVDLAIAVLGVVDFLRAPRAADLAVERRVENIVSAHASNPVRIDMANRSRRTIAGEVKDAPPLGCQAASYARRFRVPAFGSVAVTYLLRPRHRGRHAFGDIYLRLDGPWHFAQRQTRVSAAREVRAYPDIAALARDAALLARPDPESGLVALRRALGEAREFESLREYVPGDDYRAMDWKATARRSRPIARHYEPERNQTVMLAVDCGRSMVSRVGDRTRLDYAVDAALRMARVSLDRGDRVGLCAFGAQVLAYVPPKKGREALRGLVEALYGLKPELLESDYAAAIDLVAARNRRRAFIAIFSDLLDPESSRTLVTRTARLRPRHLPLVAAVADSDLLEASRMIPTTPDEAYRRVAAQRLWRDREITAASLRDAGALVVSVPARELCAAAVNRYLEVKTRGLL